MAMKARFMKGGISVTPIDGHCKKRWPDVYQEDRKWREEHE